MLDIILDPYMKALHEFSAKYKHHLQIDCSTFPALDVLELRRKLVVEEAGEFELACLAIEKVVKENGTVSTIGYMDLLVDAADALADELYVTFGSALALGLPIREIFLEVHRSNMTKSMLKDMMSVKGKTTKGKDFQPPQLREIIARNAL